MFIPVIVEKSCINLPNEHIKNQDKRISNLEEELGITKLDLHICLKENECLKARFDKLQKQFENEVKRSEQLTTKLRNEFDGKIHKLVQNTGLGFKKQNECFSKEIHKLDNKMDERIVDLTDDTENKIEEKFEEVANEVKLHEDAINNKLVTFVSLYGLR
eukprot:TRINITY_DN6391_c0_g3_i1.p1 TRINITY_DN6391_c0_g3~~TRINITY_DN6391_c0_g3_i1.p1  ORF type:complete len:160 (+),score=42.58 TRINITY_DN6391_c0_g3_i1:140-619(+)